MSNTKKTVEVNISGLKYKFNCLPSEEEKLYASAARINASMQEFKQTYPNSTFEKLLLLAALSHTHQLLEAEDASNASSSKINQLNSRFDLVLAELGSLLKSQN